MQIKIKPDQEELWVKANLYTIHPPQPVSDTLLALGGQLCSHLRLSYIDDALHTPPRAEPANLPQQLLHRRWVRQHAR